jgi:hypothetical protein
MPRLRTAVTFLLLAGLTSCVTQQMQEELEQHHERILRHELRIAYFLCQLQEAVELMKRSPAELAMRKEAMATMQEQLEELRGINTMLRVLEQRDRHQEFHDRLRQELSERSTLADPPHPPSTN